MTEEYKGVCFRCGAPLKVQHIAFSLSGEFIKFNTREVGQVTIYACDGCLEFFNQMVEGGIREAVKKWEGINAVISPA